MNALSLALQRLYCLPRQTCRVATAGGPVRTEDFSAAHLQQAIDGQAEVGLLLHDAQDRVRTLVLALAHGRDWPHLADLYRGLEQDFDLPPPALAVPADGGYQVWFSLAEAIPSAQGSALLQALQRRYLAAVTESDVTLRPGPAGADSVPLVPARHCGEPRWSAFIDPNLGGMFAGEETGLELPPNPEGQAALLARFDSIEPDALQRALAILGVDSTADRSAVTAQSTPGVAVGAPSPAPADEKLPAELAGPYADPRQFLLAVMNSPRVGAALRIQAATALLSHPEKTVQP